MSQCFTSPNYWVISSRYGNVMWNKSPKGDINPNPCLGSSSFKSSQVKPPPADHLDGLRRDLAVQSLPRKPMSEFMSDFVGISWGFHGDFMVSSWNQCHQSSSWWKSSWNPMDQAGCCSDHFGPFRTGGCTGAIGHPFRGDLDDLTSRCHHSEPRDVEDESKEMKHDQTMKRLEQQGSSDEKMNSSKALGPISSHSFRCRSWFPPISWWLKYVLNFHEFPWISHGFLV